MEQLELKKYELLKRLMSSKPQAILIPDFQEELIACTNAAWCLPEYPVTTHCIVDAVGTTVVKTGIYITAEGRKKVAQYFGQPRVVYSKTGT